jgi:hypothetical protein
MAKGVEEVENLCILQCCTGLTDFDKIISVVTKCRSVPSQVLISPVCSVN